MTMGLLGGMPVAPILGVDFVVETAVTSEGEKVPAARYTTLFVRERVYDTLESSTDQATIFDFDQEAIWICDQSQRSKTKLAFDELVRLESEASRRALRMSPLVQFTAAPEFAGRSWDPPTKILRLTHDVLAYEAELDTQIEPEIAARFRAFADWSARLNTLSPGLPPRARLELNREIAIREAVPHRIQCRRQTAAGQFETVTANHQFRRDLRPTDIELLDKCQQWFEDFEERAWGG
ncbi:MAG TPA: hypothetical protein VIY86_10015 [Pirellulaceae bacterium]